MSVQVFSPNSKITGGALFVTRGKGEFFFKLIKQIANNQDKKNNFDSSQNIIIAISSTEAAAIVRTNRERGEYSCMHKTEKATKSFYFKHYLIPAKDNQPERKGFVFGAVSGDLTIRVGLSSEKAEELALYLTHGLNYLFDLSDEEYEKKFAESQRNNQSQTTAKPKLPTNEDNADL